MLASIVVGDHFLSPNTPNQQIEIMVTGGEAIRGIEHIAAVEDGGVALGGTNGPNITAVDLVTGTVFDGTTGSPVELFASDQARQDNYTISTVGVSVPAAGVLSTLTIDTTGFFTGEFDLQLSLEGLGAETTLFGQTGAPIVTDITNGRIIIQADPTANNDTMTVLEDSTDIDAPNTIDVLGNDSTNTAFIVVAPGTNTDPDHGEVTDNGDGTFTYVPDPDYHGPDSFDYTIRNANGDEATATVNITVTPINDAPTFDLADIGPVNEDVGPVSVPAFYTNASPGPMEAGQTLTVSLANDDNGLFSVQPTINPGTGQLTYTPADDAYGTATVTVTVQDNGGTAGGGVDTATDTFTITVNPVNDAPIFTIGGNQNANEDTGPQSVPGFFSSAVPGPPNESDQTLTTTVVNDDNGLFSVQPAIDPVTGDLTYTPASNAFGTATVTVTVQDNGGTANGGDDSTSQLFTITIDPVNDPPTFNIGADQTVDEDAGGQTVNGFLFDPSPGPPNEGAQTLAFSTVNDNNGLFSVQPTVNLAGQLIYTPADDAYGTATVTVTVQDNGGTANGGNDSSSQLFTITIDPVNDAPTFVVGADQVVNEDAGGQTVGGFLGSISPGPANESTQTVTISTSNNNNGLFSAQPTIDASGELTYTPAANVSGVATVTVTVQDNGGTASGGEDTTTDTFTITVNAVNDAPTFDIGPGVTVNEDAGPQSVSSFATAISPGPADEAGQDLTFLVAADTPALFSVQPAIDEITGDLTYTPADDAFGSTTVTVNLMDDGGTALGGDDTGGPLTFTITLDPVNDAPLFTIGADQTANEDSGEQTVGGFFSSATPGPANESAQTLTTTVTNDDNLLFSVQPAIDPVSGDLTYTPASNANGTATVTVTVQDNGGTANGGDDSTSQTFTITIDAVNDPPTFNLGPDQVANEDDPTQDVAGFLSSASPGPADEASQTLTFSTSNNNNALFVVQPIIDSSGQLSYSPASNAFGVATVTVTVQDNGGTAGGGDDTTTQTFTITINEVNDAPTFTIAGDQTVDEDAGGQTVGSFLTAASPGPANESGQTLTTSTSNNNNSLFSVQPTINGSGELTYTPAADANGVATVTVTVQDNGGTANGGEDTTTQTFTITVNAVNDAPTFVVGADQVVNEDAGGQTVTGFLGSISPGPANESTQTVTITTNNDNNGLFSVQPTIDGSGELTYTPAADASGVATVTVTVQDNGGTANGGEDTTTATFTITVNAVNDAPTFVTGADQVANEDDPTQNVTGFLSSILPGPADENGQTVTISTSNNNNGLFVVQPIIDSSGQLSYSPATDAFGTATVTVTVQDNGGTANGGVDMATDTFTITINPVNDAPNVQAPLADQNVQQTAPMQTLPNFLVINDLGGSGAFVESSQSLLSITVTNDDNSLFDSQPAIDNSGTLTFEPNDAAFGTATVTVVVQDDGGTANGGIDSVELTFDITVSDQNGQPTVANVSETVLEDGSVLITLTADDGDAGVDQQLTFAIVTGPSKGTLGTITQPAAPGDTMATVLYTPDADANDGTAPLGPDTFTFTVTDDTSIDGTQLTSEEGTATVTITPVNDQPSFTVGADPTVNEDSGPASISGFATFAAGGGSDESSQSVLAYSITGNTNAALFDAGPAIGTDGTLTFTPAANANGSATITATVQDNGGVANGGVDTSTEVTFTINVTAVNDPPSFTIGADQSVAEDSGAQTASIASAISAGPADENGQTLVFNVANDANSLFSVQPSIAPNGTLTYTPAADAVGTATVTVSLSDNGGGNDTSSDQTFQITITPVNDAPSLTVGADPTVLEDSGPQSIAGFGTFAPGGGADEAGQSALAYDIVSNSNAGLFSAGPAIGTDGTLTFTPAPNANGSATITATVQDDGGVANGGEDTSSVETFTINVTAVNDEPTFTVGVDQSSLEDAGLQTVGGFINDASAGPADESGQTLTFTVTNDNNGLFTTQPSIDSSGTLTYESAADASGMATVTVVLSDNGGTANGGDDTSPSQTFMIEIDPDNDDPIANDDSISFADDDVSPQTAAAPGVLANDTDIDSDSSQFMVTEVEGNISNVGNGIVLPNSGATLTLDADGSYSIAFVPGNNGIDVVSYTMTDGDGGSASANLTINIGVGNLPPTVVDDTATVAEGADVSGIPVEIDVLADDSDDDGDTIGIESFTQGAEGTVTRNDNSTPGDTSDDTLFYTANDPNFNGTDTFTYTVSDGNGGTTVGDVTVTVTPEPDDPTAVDDSRTVLEDGAVIIDVLTNDFDVDDAVNDPPSFSINTYSQGAIGTVTQSGNNLIYTPNADANGNDSFTYTIIDNTNRVSNTATVSVTVTPQPDNPVAVDDFASAIDGVPQIIDVLDNDFDVDGDTLTIDSFTQGSNGIVTDNGDGTLSYTSNSGFGGVDTFSYTISDGTGRTATADVEVTVDSNDDPIANDDSVAGVPVNDGTNTPFVIDAPDLILNDVGETGEILQVISVSSPGSAGGTVVLNDGGTPSDPSDDTIEYTPAVGFSGRDTFTYTLSDNTGPSDNPQGPLTDTATVTVLVGDDPVFFDGDDLVVVGTGAADRIIFFPGNTPGLVYVRLNSETFGPFSVPGGGMLTAFGLGGNDAIIASGRLANAANFDGGVANDYMTGSTLDDILIGGSGNDVILAGEGNNYVEGGDGSDRLEGRSGIDTLIGGAGNDRINGGDGDDLLLGNTGNDSIFGGGGNDFIRGGSGDDNLSGYLGDDLIVGGDGIDMLFGRQGNDVLLAGNGVDRLRGDDGDDLLIGSTTDYDNNDAALLDILATWSGGGSFTDRISAINSGANPLTFGGTVTDDSAIDEFTGGTGQDWFFLFGLDRDRDLRSDDLAAS